MNYENGAAVLIGDRVDLGGGMTGVVVAVIDTGDFSAGYAAKEWSYLRAGILVESSQAGVVHYPGAWAGLVLLGRADAGSRDH
ncbi:hypothetical protein [Marilutibacter chinensis]|uniref:Uncharacterized protein n=1 Tax=Marilutibacter chinensis TaxID=2912247 RepID=A0ABS9HVS6_9GAMM|nr:hypothetical protein [Lysobacter chinensis]MCF7222492.1 hypothetical protein [Lysobacter chinensis]